MMLVSALEQAWKDIELAFEGGYLVNQTMLTFAWWKAMHKRRPDLHITYEAGTPSIGTAQPGVIISQDGAPSSVLFAGELLFFPHGLMASKSLMAKLRHADRSLTLAVPMRDPKSGEIARQQMAKSSAFTLGLFLVAQRESVHAMHTRVMQNLTASGRGIFHFAFGAVEEDRALKSKFQYVPPKSVP